MRWRSLVPTIGLALVGGLAACSGARPAAPATEGPAAALAAGASPAPAQPTLPPTATGTPGATPLPPTASPTWVPSPTPQPPACLETAGAVITATIPSPTLRYDIDARIYLPPCYAASSRRYPVLYLIHGLGFTQDQWERLGATSAADALIRAGEIAPLIIVLPRDRRDARLDPALVRDLVPYIDATYRTVAAREARAIGGLSRGGGWAVHFGLKYPEAFSRVGLHSPAVFYDDEANILEWSRQLKDKPRLTIYMDVGESDATIRSPLWLDQLFTWFELNHTFLVQPGGHSERYWSQHVRDYLRFYAGDWRHMTFAGPPND